ncbi:interleukin-12 subunit beta-like [Pyxicephalus adspersus]|uniref:interleukin-12 subunit beta-like n=1 Tax=Pyxicephalus adspersus TaxID=30357 RepID=UPI003B59C5A8
MTRHCGSSSRFSDYVLKILLRDSYSSRELRCSTNHQFIGPVLVRAKAYRRNALESSPWKQTLHREGRLNFMVPISSVFCPYGEHTNPFHVLVEVMTQKEYWRVEVPLSMTDAVVPGAPENLNVKGDQITWSYPTSWPRPSSFFPLLFQINIRKRNNMKNNQTLEETTYSKKNIREFQVRCRDLYSSSSPWSSWSQTLNPLQLGNVMFDVMALVGPDRGKWDLLRREPETRKAPKNEACREAEREELSAVIY